MNTTLRATYSKAGQAGWHGALKDAAGRIVWTCEHAHRNRDQASAFAGQSACQCAGAELSRRFPEAARAKATASIPY